MVGVADRELLSMQNCEVVWRRLMLKLQRWKVVECFGQSQTSHHMPKCGRTCDCQVTDADG